MMKNNNGKIISGVSSLVVFCVFAVCTLVVLLLGAKSYSTLTSRDRQSWDSRICTQFLSSKLRQAGSASQVEIRAFGDGDAILLHEEINGESYITRVYCHDGWLMELFTAAEAELAPEDGERITPMTGLEIISSDGLVRFRITDGNGAKSELVRALRGTEGGDAE